MNKFVASTALAALALTIGITSSNAAVINRRGGDQSTESPADCKGDMGMLFHVHPKTISAMKNQAVYLSPICENQSLLTSGDVGTLFQDGNVTGLRPTIGKNRLLASALYSKNYSQDDVVGIRVNRSTNEVILYVHKHSR